MRNIKLILEYDGTNFCGWQWQPRDRTVQGELQKSLARILQEQVKIIGSGRTDTGVHALGQVANLHIHSEMSVEKIKAGLNGTLPKDIRVLSVEIAPPQFNARYDAQKREYHYSISRRQRAIGRCYCWYYKAALDLAKIRQASQHLIGEHDFRSFCQTGADVSHFICRVELIDWIEQDDLIVLKIIADRFLHNMVRIIVGTMLEVGVGKIDPPNVKEILMAKDRKRAGPTVPPRGLCLVKVYYD